MLHLRLTTIITTSPSLPPSLPPSVPPQIPDLVDQFDVWVLSIPPDDRSSLSLVTQAVVRHLEKR